jgi:plastocyanin
MHAHFLVGALLAGCLTTPLAAQKAHAIKLVHTENTSLYRFEPNTVTASPGDVLVFTVESGGPYLVAFQPGDFTAPARALMVAAIPGSNAELRGPAITRKGDSFRITLPSLPPGQYRFYSVTHVAYRMAGNLVVR